MGKTHKTKKFEELQLQDDFMFGIIMRNPKYCKQFLETVLCIKIKHIEYPQTQAAIDLSIPAKSIRLDVYVDDDEGTVYNIEMQTTNSNDLPKRVRYYHGLIDLNILEKGADYAELTKSYVIFVCTFDLFGEGRHIYTFENRCIQDTKLALQDEAMTVILNTKGVMNDISPEMQALLSYIDGNNPTDDYTKELEKAVQEVRNNKKWRVDYMTLERKFSEIRKEGREEGREEGRREIAFHLYRKNKFSAKEAAELLGISEKAFLEHFEEFQKQSSF